MNINVSSIIKGPTIPYPGAKARLAPTLAAFMPSKGRVYLEPLVGRGNVFWTVALNHSFEHWHVNDISTAPFFDALRTVGDGIAVPPRTRKEFYRQKAKYADGDPAAILLEPYLTFSGGGYKKGGFGSKHGPTVAGYQNALRRCYDIMHATRVKISRCDWRKLKLDGLTHEDFVFFDPPYFGADVRAYTNKFDFDGLLGTLKRAKFRWMLTEYRQPFYVEALGEPQLQKSMQLACDGIGTRQRVECVWTNFADSKVVLAAA